MTTTPKFSDTPPDERQPTHGPCSACGFLAALDSFGRVGAHLQIRIDGFRPDGAPNEYRTSVRCDGEGQQPDEVA